MANIMRIAYGILIIFFVTNVNAQTVGGAEFRKEELLLRDSFVMKLNERDKLFIIGNDLEKISNYKSADSLLMLFINDWEQAVKNQSVSPESRVVHYFVHPSGKRRLKAETTDYIEPAIDVNAEIKRLNLDLPAHVYIIHDIASGYDISIYIQDPSDIRSILGNVNVNESLKEMHSNKKLMRKNYKLVYSGKYNEEAVRNARGRYSFEAIPAVGIGIIGNTVSPSLGLEFYFMSRDKYGVPELKAGFNLTNYIVTTISQSSVSVAPITSYDLRFCAGTRNIWYGLSFGLFSSAYGKGAHYDYTISALNKRPKFGFIIEGVGPVNYGLDFVALDGKRSLIVLSLRLPF